MENILLGSIIYYYDIKSENDGYLMETRTGTGAVQ